MTNIIRRLYDKFLTNEFHKMYYNSGNWTRTKWHGITTLKTPLDLWIYQEIMSDIKPDFVIETGTNCGGSAFFMAHVMYVIGKGNIITIDIEKKPRPKHQRIKYITGSSTDEKILENVKSLTENSESIMVILDSDHTENHVTKELNLYSSFVTKGSYLIVEDTNINGNPVLKDFGPGPMEALEKFIAKNTNYEIDKTKEKFFLTCNPKGYLKKKL